MLLTNHVQEEDGCVWAQAVLCIGCHLEDPCTLVHVLDAILDGAEVSIGHGDPIPKVKLDVCPLEITLQGEEQLVTPIGYLILCLHSLRTYGLSPGAESPSTQSPDSYLLFTRHYWQTLWLCPCMPKLGAAWGGWHWQEGIRQSLNESLKWGSQGLPSTHGQIISLLCHNNKNAIIITANTYKAYVWFHTINVLTTP